MENQREVSRTVRLYLENLREFPKRIGLEKRKVKNPNVSDNVWLQYFTLHISEE